MEEWQAQDKKDRSPTAPRPVYPHLSDYTPAALSIQLQQNETLGLGQLIIRDEMSGLLQAISNDTQQGSGTGEAQLLEAFDGDGYSSIRVESAPRSYDACHVSIFGNIQPDLLRELINGQDSTGKFARFLFCRVPAKALLLDDDDPTAPCRITPRGFIASRLGFTSSLLRLRRLSTPGSTNISRTHSCPRCPG